MTTPALPGGKVKITTMRRKTMKKLLAIMLTLVMVLGLAACGGQK